jgi:hypothetical protein
MLGLFGRMTTCSARSSLRTVSAVRHPYHRYSSPAPDTQEEQEPTEAEKQQWEKELIAKYAFGFLFVLTSAVVLFHPTSVRPLQALTLVLSNSVSILVVTGTLTLWPGWVRL